MRLSGRPILRVKGQAELIGALFAFMVLVTFIIYVVANVLPLAARQQLQIQETQSFKQLQELEKEGLVAVWNPTSKVLEIYNNSTISVRIARIWVEESGNVEPIQVDIIVRPKSKVEWAPHPHTPGLKPLRVETSRGITVDVKTVKPAQEREPPNPPNGPNSPNTKYIGDVLKVPDLASLISNPNIHIDRKLVEEPTLDNIRKGKTSGMVRYIVIEEEKPGWGLVIDYDRCALVLEKEYTDVCVHVDGYPGVFIFGYAPGTDNKLYNALLTGTIYGVEIRVKNCTTGRQIDSIILNLTGYVRAKLLGLEVTEFYFDHPTLVIVGFVEGPVYTGHQQGIYGIPIPPEALGYWYYNIFDVDDTGREIWEVWTVLELYGKVKKLKIYREHTVERGQESSYEPYLLIADVDGNGVPELIFTDEDASYGSCNKVYCDGHTYYFCTTNDHYIGGAINISNFDGSKRPFLLYLKGQPIDPEKHGGVMISLRWYFHDNEDCEQACIWPSLRSLPILGLYLVDPGEDGELGTQDDKIIVRSEYAYEYLTKFENTYPPNQHYLTLTETLVVPENVATNKLYVAIGFNDPYWGTKFGEDDVDITLAIELLGITLLPRTT